MSKLLINEPPLMVIPTLAKALGVNSAIILQQIHYWNTLNNNVIDGYQWCYNSYASWAEQFSWLTERGVRKIITDLENNGYLITANFNKKSFDKTKWYRINYEALDELDRRCGTQCHTMRHSMTDDAALNDTPIPETTTETTTEKNNIYGSSTKKQLQEERFMRFWEAYPKKLNKGAARKAFYKINPDDEMLETFLTAIKKQSMLPDWMKDKGQFIPYPASWLNGERWEDDTEVKDLRMERIKSFRNFEVNDVD